MIQTQRVDAGRGVAWIGDGFRIFGAAAGLWIVIALIVIVIFIVCAVIPFIGFLAASLLGPVLGAGMLIAAREADAKRPVEIGHLFQGFKDSRVLNGLLALGGVLIAGTIATLLVSFLLLGSVFMAALQATQGTMPPAFGIGALIGVLIVLAIQFAVAAAVVYAVPLVTFKGAAVGEAMSASINACLVDFLPLLVFGVIYLVLAIIASVPFGLGWLVLLPASAGMLYASYRDIFGG